MMFRGKEIGLPRSITLVLSSAVLLGMMLFMAVFDIHAIQPDEVLGFLASKVFGLVFLLPFYGFPPIVSLLFVIFLKNTFSQFVLSLTSLLYGGWFAYQMYTVFYVFPSDAQNGLVFVFVGIYFLPVALPLWITAIIVEILIRWKAAAKA